MHPSVAAMFRTYTVALEGEVRHFYADVLGLVTIGVGNLVDPVHTALGLPLRHPDGRLASRAEIAAEWHTVKADPRSATQGHRYSAARTALRLDDAGLEALVQGKLAANDAALHRRYPGFEGYPADAQLLLHSLAWACGAAYRFPALDRAVAAEDWLAAGREAQMDTKGPDRIAGNRDDNHGLHPRNARHVHLGANAAAVRAHGSDPSVLHWPARAV